MTELGFEDFETRKIDMYGGSQAVGSVLWLEHCEALHVPMEEGSSLRLSPQDLIEDENLLKEKGHIDIHKLKPTDLEKAPPDKIMRYVVLPNLPLKITGNEERDPLVLNVDFKAFSTPRSLTYHSGVLGMFDSGYDDEEELERKLDELEFDDEASLLNTLNAPGDDLVPTFTVRFNPLKGAVASFAAYPASGSEDYAVNAIEVDDQGMRALIGGRIFTECFRERQADLPALHAPHQF
ncbi:MAG TPA: hypothetical protein VFX86_02780 [Candidatus Saccharimonadales bacterium]|nr:hypothetical protein [Candidatus Saccharimonadales bacterium]